MASWWWTQQLNKGIAGQSSSNNPPIPFDTLSSFQKTLQELMELKYENHWYPHQPDRGHAYRSIMCDRRVIDNLLLSKYSTDVSSSAVIVFDNYKDGCQL